MDILSGVVHEKGTTGVFLRFGLFAFVGVSEASVSAAQHILLDRDRLLARRPFFPRMGMTRLMLASMQGCFLASWHMEKWHIKRGKLRKCRFVLAG
jgi:hypothetical protein